ncbi:chemotaxis protein MotB [Limimonas halophila]|uniref:Chemotaxis protein MotB n=1 Tax=Limimonas halophila TaxID=1082479 RepID=A0A1G7Q6E7_9PROT|nr:flagellar motor protein MotB [Limimonas halophila]SDF94038.1 chemotaxis protein MotB [Limimonas halophila]
MTRISAEDTNDQGPGVSARDSKNDGAGDSWLVTFTDLVALMLTFFVMLFAMQSVDNAKWQNLTDSLQERLSSVMNNKQASPTLQLDMPGKDAPPGADLDYIGEVVRTQLDANSVLDQSLVRRKGNRLFISMPGRLLFESGSYQLTDKAREAVFALGGFLRNISNRVQVAGYADPRKPTQRYPSNWELSVLRARTVATALQNAGYAGGVVTYGYGDAQYDGLPEDLPDARRRELGRRVDVIVSRNAREGA